MKKHISVSLGFLSLLLLSSFALSCGSESTSPAVSEKTTDPVSSSETEEVTEPLYKTDLPDDLDFGGETLRVYNINTANTWFCPFYMETESPDILETSIYRRNRKLEEKLNIGISETLLESVDDMTKSREYVYDLICKNVSSGADVYDMMFVDCRDALTLAQGGYLIPIDSIPYVNLHKEYWNQSINRDISIAGRLYFSFGDYNLSGYAYTDLMLVNMPLLSSLDLPDPYEQVLSGQWTFDRFREYTMAATRDLDGSGQLDDNDQFGFTARINAFTPNLWVGAGERLIEKDEEDIPVFNLLENERFADCFRFGFEMIYDRGVMRPKNEDEYTLGYDTVFAANRALYTIICAMRLPYYRDMKADYGIIPFPKYDEEQSTYYSSISGGAVTVTPTTAEDRTEMIGACMEALACESRNSVIPVYFDQILGSKYVRDEASSQMLDLIFGNSVFDFGTTIWNDVLRDGYFVPMVKNNDRNLSSALTKLKPRVEKIINRLIDDFEDA